MIQPTPTSRFVCLEGIQRGNRFYSSFIPGEDPTKSAKGEVWYRVLGYAETSEEAQRILWPTQADQDAAIRAAWVKTLLDMARLETEHQLREMQDALNDRTAH